MDTRIEEDELVEIPFFLPENIVKQITFDNVNEIAYLLATEDSVVAKALVDELLYFRDKGVI
ncbi:MAG: hypothetical protein WC179_05130 [Candidatus Cloacimonadaceae bacterium]